MPIIASGVGSGIDVSGLVQGLVDAERAPRIIEFDTRQATIDLQAAAISSLDNVLTTLKEKVDVLKDATLYTTRSAASGDSSLFTATAESNAVLGEYDIEVVALAVANKKGSTYDPTISTGTLSLQVNGASFSVTIDSSNNTLAGVRDAINNANDNVGISATVVTVDAGSRLVLTSNETGLSNNIVVLQDDPGLGFTDIDAAADAQLRIDTQLVSSANNTFIDAIEGVTINAVSVPSPAGTTAKLTVALDKSGVTIGVQNFVDAYNAVVEEINVSGDYDAETKTSGVLLGDATLRTIESQLRSLLGTINPAITSPYDSLSALGVTVDVDGKLSLKDATLKTALDSNNADVATYFSDTNSGFAVVFSDALQGYTQINGILDLRSESLEARLDDIADQRLALEGRMASLESRLLAQFGALDSLVANLRATGDFLTSNLDNIPTFNSRKS